MTGLLNPLTGGGGYGMLDPYQQILMDNLAKSAGVPAPTAQEKPRLAESPNFMQALGNLGAALAVANQQGMGFGGALAMGANAFGNSLQAQKDAIAEAERQAAKDRLDAIKGIADVKNQSEMLKVHQENARLRQQEIYAQQQQQIALARALGLPAMQSQAPVAIPMDAPVTQTNAVPVGEQVMPSVNDLGAAAQSMIDGGQNYRMNVGSIGGTNENTVGAPPPPMASAPSSITQAAQADRSQEVSRLRTLSDYALVNGNSNAASVLNSRADKIESQATEQQRIAMEQQKLQNDNARLVLEQNKPAIEAETEANKNRQSLLNDLNAASSNLPTLYSNIERLRNQANNATYTTAGKLYDAARREMNLEPRSSAKDAASYVSNVRNTILPLLKQTFGAAFTENEGKMLAETLGDINLSPQEKQVVIDEFVAAKHADVLSKARAAGVDLSTIPAPPSQQVQEIDPALLEHMTPEERALFQ